MAKKVVKLVKEKKTAPCPKHTRAESVGRGYNEVPHEKQALFGLIQDSARELAHLIVDLCEDENPHPPLHFLEEAVRYAALAARKKK